jgi:hypothetical protein
LRAYSVPAAIIDIRTRLVKDWSWRASIQDTSKGYFFTSCFMFESCLESLTMHIGQYMPSFETTLTAIHECRLMWPKHVEVAKGQEGVTNYALCTRRQRRTNELLIRGTRDSRFGAEVGLGIVVIGLKVGGHVVGCAHVLSGS